MAKIENLTRKIIIKGMKLNCVSSWIFIIAALVIFFVKKSLTMDLIGVVFILNSWNLAYILGLVKNFKKEGTLYVHTESGLSMHKLWLFAAIIGWIIPFSALSYAVFF